MSSTSTAQYRLVVPVVPSRRASIPRRLSSPVSGSVMDSCAKEASAPSRWRRWASTVSAAPTRAITGRPVRVSHRTGLAAMVAATPAAPTTTKPSCQRGNGAGRQTAANNVGGNSKMRLSRALTRS